MLFFSTRNENLRADGADALLNGIASDGGLFVPEVFPELAFNSDKLAETKDGEISAAILSAFFSDSLFKGDKFPDEKFSELVKKAYGGKFDGGDFAPVKKVGGIFVTELFHGPTCAFKDVALQILPRLTVEAKRAKGTDDKLFFLTATSGDTGSAALEGFSGVEGTEAIVFYPERGTSEIQKRQMVTASGENTRVYAVKGNFDDAQRGVKEILGKLEMPEKARLSSANSINIGRLVPQISYYFKTYRDLLVRGEIKYGDKVDFIVPTGNFGDILAGFFAEKAGLPIGKLVSASNRNNVISDFIRTGVYDAKRRFYLTYSPSMDILVSSNLERLLYIVCGDEKCAKYMSDLKNYGKYAVSKEELSKIRETFSADFATEEETLTAIKRVYEKYGYLTDTHTAVAWSVYEKVKNSLTGKAAVVLATASPYKFPTSILKAFGEKESDERAATEKLFRLTGADVPAPLKNVWNKPIYHKKVIEKEEMLSVVTEAIRERL